LVTLLRRGFGEHLVTAAAADSDVVAMKTAPVATTNDGGQTAAKAVASTLARQRHDIKVGSYAATGVDRHDPDYTRFEAQLAANRVPRGGKREPAMNDALPPSTSYLLTERTPQKRQAPVANDAHFQPSEFECASRMSAALMQSPTVNDVQPTATLHTPPRPTRM
jgi:hypothetical protein